MTELKRPNEENTAAMPGKTAAMLRKAAVVLLLAGVPAGMPAQPRPTADTVQAGMTLLHPWQGKHVGYIGDSITDPRNGGGKIKKYWQFLQEWLGITPYVYGISGRQWNDVERQAIQLKQEHGDEVDAVLVFMGTNDFNHGVPIGEWFTETTEKVYAAQGKTKQLETRKKRHPVMSDDTFRGRVNKGMAALKRIFPDKQIVLLTPLHRALANFNDKNVQPEECYQNWCGEYVDAYIQAVKDAGNLWGCP